eukprot:NODE_8743_length_280_cov_39.129870_g8003_i0.p2 GENE.NODE_8743_length_280_cov_39.129870_g8003_i0~~NODE_8743_length_280_cov_39.129870_g8003_i0.p2  ORF type:complete len:51 (+),score=5.14 NODE_8743_length_280_cov_39.129870_g8003_i0:48-200(+)
MIGIGTGIAILTGSEEMGPGSAPNWGYSNQATNVTYWVGGIRTRCPGKHE